MKKEEKGQPCDPPNKFVYYNKRDYNYEEIKEDYLESPYTLDDYFGASIEDHMSNNEFIVYKLVPYKVLKKEINWKFV